LHIDASVESILMDARCQQQVLAREGPLRRFEKCEQKRNFTPAHGHRTARRIDQFAAAPFRSPTFEPVATLNMTSTLRLNFERYLRLTWEETHHLEQSQQEHREILELCRSKDIDQACSALQRHIAATGALLVRRLEARI
jgi:DNA-binding GntR family transcriptional regulator